MTRKSTYYLLLLTALVLAVAGCSNRKRLNQRVSLWRNDKIPYGTWYAYNELKQIFPDAEVVINKLSPDRYRGYTVRKADEYEEAGKHDDKKMLYLVITGQVVPDESELAALFNMVGQGKHIFISAMRVGSNLLDSLKLETAYNSTFYNFSDSLTVSINNPVTFDSASFTYPGRAMDNFFLKMDSSITTILGKDEFGRANFVKFNYESGGSIYINLAPATFTNFFLLHKNNKAYYDYALSYIPKDIEVVKWDDYFRYHVRGDNSDNVGSSFSALGWISKQPGLSTALWLLVILFALIFLFESKRKQRIIPLIAPLKNASLDFVTTIGRLYFQRRDNRNLAHKMTAHFLDQVRSKYNIRTSPSEEEFVKRLAWKSGYDIERIQELLYYIRYVHDSPDVNDETLLELNRKLQHFYGRES